ncbi:TPA: hypothetical protein PXI76_002778 [Yersinia enterocolitica]|nr:hypothetical protein [Yersinia enterocolitica]HDL8421239.1 hypothetical protein [Yersinia enterocolitica]
MKELDGFTVERLEELSIEEDLYNFPPTQGELNSLARIALAAKRAEPVGYVAPEALGYKNFYNAIMTGNASVRRSMPLYTIPQLSSPDIPDERLIVLANHIQSSLGGLPDEWQSWADEIVSDLRKYAAPEKQNG